MRDFVEHFKNDVWGNQGPMLMTRVWNRTKLVDALPVETFYPIVWGGRVTPYFTQPEAEGDAAIITERTLGVHMWNRLTGKLTWHNDSFMSRTMRRACPGVLHE